MKTDLELMQGRWVQVLYERDGVANPTDVEHAWDPVTTIHEKTFSVTISDGSLILEGTFELFDKDTPRAVDWSDVSGPYASDHLIRAIYEVTENNFAFCAAYDGGARPREFHTQTGQVLRRMERVG